MDSVGVSVAGTELDTNQEEVDKAIASGARLETGNCSYSDYETDESNEQPTESNVDEKEERLISPYEFLFPYDTTQDDDDDDDFSSVTDPEFLDVGWDGEYLQDLEDIDFEFVYALHTFVATVEGQANATKGDTMVLLDDSNSYWWLVRVVKDSSIGKCGIGIARVQVLAYS